MKIQLPNPPQPALLQKYDKGFLAQIYERMILIRNFELAVNDLFLQGHIPGTIHLSHGQEASVVGTALALKPDDFITLTHRGHGQALAKGVSPRSLMAELLGKETGCCKGKGGSLHVGDMVVGALPAIAIVGASSPIAAGMAFAFKRRKTNQVVCNFFGDGTTNKGDWHEAMNLASLWYLPMVFLCENNLYGVSTHISDVMLNEFVAERASAYRMPGLTIYGNDPIEVFEHVSQAVQQARKGGGPSLIECLTYRGGGHKRDDPATYRPKEEVDAWLAEDPLPRFKSRLLADPRFTEADIELIDARVQSQLKDAVDFAIQSNYPSLSLALEHIYAG